MPLEVISSKVGNVVNFTLAEDCPQVGNAHYGLHMCWSLLPKALMRDVRTTCRLSREVKWNHERGRRRVACELSSFQFSA